MTNAERIEALEAQVAALTAAVLLGDPFAAAKMLSAQAGEPADEAEAPVEPEAAEEPAEA